MNKLQILLSNKHTTGAAIAWGVGSAIQHLGPVWMPSRASECDTTGRWICGMAIMYGLALAGDAKPLADTDNQPKKGNT